MPLNRLLRSGLFAVLLLAAASSGARAQATIDVIPFAGYRIGGSLVDDYTGTDFDIRDDWAYGGAIDVRLPGGRGIEFLYTTQDTELRGDSYYYPGLSGEVDLKVDYWHIGGLQEYPTGGVATLYAAGTLGLTSFRFPGDSEERFSLGFGGGAKIMPGERIGLRFDGRLYTTFVGSSTYYLTAGGGGASLSFASEVLFQGEFTGGVVVRFGGP